MIRLALLASLLPLACSSEPSVARAAITSGTDDDADPGVVALFPAGALGTIDCSGTVVAPRVILTAAHCVKAGGTPASFGPSPGVPPGVTIAVLSSHVHPKFKIPYRRFDVALLLLSQLAPSPPATLAVVPNPSL